MRFERADGTVLAIVPKHSCELLGAAAQKIQSRASYTLSLIYLAGLEEPNAFATLDKEGRPVAVVTIGMLSAVGPDEEAWAGLLGHEIAHHVKRHGEGRDEAQTIAKNTGQAAANLISQLIPGIGGVIGGTIGGTATQMAMYGAYTRPQEAEADTLALQWMVDAGYDPRGMTRLFSALAKGSSTSSALSFLSTHPANEDRQRAVEAFIASRASTGENPEPSQPPALPSTTREDVPYGACAATTSQNHLKAFCVEPESCQQKIDAIKQYCNSAANSACVSAYEQLPINCNRASAAYSERSCDAAAYMVHLHCTD